MLQLSEATILARIKAGELFECELLDGSLTLKIEDYTPAICTAIHAGHNMQASTEKFCRLSKAERLFEEDPYTCQLIDSMPITLVGGDSRYEYDLNRPIATCIYTKAWGQEVWHAPLPTSQRRKNIARHQCFYRILDALIAKIEERFGACLVFDVHSYNYLRHNFNTPTFNLGVEQIDQDRWSQVVDYTLDRLSRVELPNTPTRAACNDIFYGRGYLIAHTNSRFENTLVLPLEIKKVFMEEESGELYPLVFNVLKQALQHCFSDSAAFFSRRHTRKQRVKRIDMLSSKLDPAIRSLDKSLYKLAKGLETLHYINPINIAQEQKRFFSRHGNYQPNFRYRPLDIDPYHFREQLYRLPVDNIRDPGIEQMYRQVVEDLSSKIDLLINAGQPDFIYNSLKYYGEPSLIDESNASFILHSADYEAEAKIEYSVDAIEMLTRFKRCAEQWNMPCKVELSSRIVAKAMVLNSKKTLYVNKTALMTETQANALLHHELGVHMATTLNAAKQPLKVFSLGLPGNTMSQEGLAILNELHSGNLPLSRLKELALRVVAVREMVRHNDFRHTYQLLADEHQMPPEQAFKLAVRVHRGGGFSKDYLYLRGVSIAFNLYQQKDMSGLYVGKTGFDSLPIIDEMISREIIEAPTYVPQYLRKPTPTPPILDYLMNSIRPPLDFHSTRKLCA